MAEPAADLLKDYRVRAAVAASHLRGLPAHVLTSLLTGARRTTAPAGHILHRVGEVDRHVELVVSGLARVHVSAPDGRTLTVRYCHRGALMGVLSLYAEPFVMPATTQVVVDSELVAVSPTVVRALADRDVRVAKALLLELSERAAAFAAENRWLDVRHRSSARRAAPARSRCARQKGAELETSVSQQELADAVGTVREVVVRTLRDLRERGLIETGRHGIRIHAADRLLEEAYPDPWRRWNTGP